jgi:hypothetical protein
VRALQRFTNEDQAEKYAPEAYTINAEPLELMAEEAKRTRS